MLACRIEFQQQLREINFPRFVTSIRSFLEWNKIPYIYFQGKNVSQQGKNSINVAVNEINVQ